MTRDEHLAWCKQRAIEYADRGDSRNALASFLSDVRKHPETARLAVFALLAATSIEQGSGPAMRKFIEDFA